MPKIAYMEQAFSAETRRIIAKANEIIADYASQGYDLTLRQLYYQLVARDLIPNQEKSYKRLGTIINDARLCGEIDWNAIVDRTRFVRGVNTWEHPREILDACGRSFTVDKWEGQPKRVEVWVEKDALVGVFGRVCGEWQLPLFSCRGYRSQSEMWASAQRLASIIRGGQEVDILHFGDHDPSGLDMSRDIQDRLLLFGAEVVFHRIALNMDQVEEHQPPPNPAKVTDSRYEHYRDTFGEESWELDALPPQTLSALVTDFVRANVQMDAWERQEAKEASGRAFLATLADSAKTLAGEYGFKDWTR